MPIFTTPEPISVAIDLVVGNVRITAGDRADTVEVGPSDGSHEPDVRAAEQTRVGYAAGRLLVKAPKQRGLGLFGRVGSIDVTIELPAGSHVQAESSVAAFSCVGQLGECRVKTSSADIQLDHTGRLEVNTGGGAIVVDRVAGHVEVSTGSGKVPVLQIDGTAVIKNSNGDIWVGEITGDVRLNAANGDISVDHAHAGITANGDVRIGEITRGSAALRTAFGEIEIGTHPGTVARLDVHTSFGRVHTAHGHRTWTPRMDTADGPESCDETVEVRANTSYGDIEIRHSSDPERTHRMEPA